MNFWTLFAIFAILVTLDKGLTAVNIHQVGKNFPSAVEGDTYKIERNPLARWFFNQMGLIGGTFAYWVVGMATLFGAFFLAKPFFHESTILYTFMMVYGLVITNNTYFLLKYSMVIS